ncbi:amino acid/amide ABC transporter membrane protein 2 (HAAT family) [Paucimonas lemoignei]|uniref:Amino acid/amide ABC transporter membrane protein 2 (HAAT family) n=1 Tax=Paucimonas lemoignei TaxID=29443 RepID=A0A4R3HXQ7_PAULE|nr:branched-chain amino acid ABC transporter permease [Paucimonas lemoignei]TCS37061.1 amino acid/amide ABC transporter membrane protein 2 (HAAT family) [Paucimonas lemoignei]
MRTELSLLAAAVVIAVGGFVAPDWLSFLLTLAFAKALVVLGVVVQMRMGLVTFGQALFYALGGYAAGMAMQHLGVRDAFVLLGIGVVVSAGFAAICGLLLARYRDIFFAMLTMALSMVLFGVLVKSSALGSTDGFNVSLPTYLGWEPSPESAKGVIFLLTVAVSAVAAIAFHRLLKSGLGLIAEAVRENEVRVEYLGISPRSAIYANYIFAAGISALGGGLTALATGHIDPDMAVWTTSGEFVFIAILGGTGHVAAPFVAAIVFAAVRTFAIQESPHTWQLTLGAVLLILIIFLPKGLWSLVSKRRKQTTETPVSNTAKVNA